MTIYISTGGFSKLTAYEASKKLSKYKIKNIELSGGLYSKKMIEELNELNTQFNIQLHNYFPPPKKPFVLNLASLNKNIQKKSYNHILQSINLCKILGTKFYSFHAGFLCDIKPSELGKKIKKKQLNSRSKGKKIFINSVIKLAKIAKKNNIKLMIENNVLSKKNYIEFEGNPFLMAEPLECKQLMSKFPKNVGLLIDVAHLKVSSKTLRFEPKKMFDLCKNRVFGYHLSDNDGLSDSNMAFNTKAWFWKYLDKNKEYFSIEVYNHKIKKLVYLLSLTKKKLNKE